jgi:hypothetical protein
VKEALSRSISVASGSLKCELAIDRLQCRKLDILFIVHGSFFAGVLHADSGQRVRSIKHVI